MKRAVKVAKRKADWRWGERLWNDFEGNEKRIGEQARDEMMKDVNCQILRDGVGVRRRRSE